MSRLALTALGFNIPCFLPPFTLIAALLGVVAWIRIARAPTRLRGAPIAIAAVVLGAALTALGTSYWWPAARLMIAGPQDAVVAASDRDFAAFRREFIGPGAIADDDRISRFADLLLARHGRLLRARRDFTEGEATQSGEVWTVPYRLEFERGHAVALVDITTRDPATGSATLKISAIRVRGEPPIEFPPPRESPTLPAP
ncbi:MAG: hypothetical protein FJ253_06870 [Phycisphaerae bacterium]|nr:hypothetical protein [Phycisphaerae bacterium]